MVKHVVRYMATRSPVLALLNGLAGRHVTLFMLHRFAEDPTREDRHHPHNLARALEYLRRHRYPLVSLADIVATARGGPPLPPRAVAFTVDDGYADFLALALPVFERYDCPVSVFLTTGFIDGQVWMWWDRLATVFRATARRRATVTGGGPGVLWSWSSDGERLSALAAAVELLTYSPPADRDALIAALARELEVDLPSRAPADYAAMTWEEVRAAEARGVGFGAHTLDHPTLATIPDPGECGHQIAHSYARLQQHVTALPVFCYPNGDARSFGQREIDLVAKAGFALAVTALPGHLPSGTTVHGWPRDRQLTVPRLPYPDDHARFRQNVSGLERVTSTVRRMLAGLRAGGPAIDGKPIAQARPILGE
jgi:peptidoglycan/xylan/chitin deacetylase (PgdA/CDA1 family)